MNFKSNLLLVLIVVTFSILPNSGESVDIINGFNVTEYFELPPLSDGEYFDQCYLYGPSYKYCIVELQLLPLTNVTSRVWDLIQRSNQTDTFPYDWLFRGRCLEKKNDLTEDEEIEQQKEFFNRQFHSMGLQVEIRKITCNEFDRKWDYLDKTCVFVFAVIFLTVAVCTALDIRNSKRGEVKAVGQKYIECFSIPKNFKKLMDVSSDGQHQYLHGLKAFVTFFIVDGHIKFMYFKSPIYNVYQVELYHRSPTIMKDFLGPTLVQYYFTMSGYLLGVAMFKYVFEKKFSSKYIWLGIIGRYIRLVPAYLLMTLFHASIFYHLNTGPFWEHIIGHDRETCRQLWWANLLCITNLIDPNKVCLVYGWFMSADFQLHIFALLLLTYIWFNRSKVKQILGFTFLISILLPGIITYVYNLDPFVIVYPKLLRDFMHGDRTYGMAYVPFYTNGSSYILGLILAYFTYTGDIKKSPSNSKWFTAFLLFMFHILTVTVFACGYFVMKNRNEYSMFTHAIFASLYKLGFGAKTAIVIWLAHIREDNVYIRFFKSKPLIIFGKLSFAIYLTHWSVLEYLHSIEQLPIYYNDYKFWERLIVCLTFSLVAAVTLALCFEYPIGNLFKLAMAREMKSEIEKKKNIDENDNIDSKINKNGSLVNGIDHKKES